VCAARCYCCGRADNTEYGQGGILDNVGKHITVLNIFKGRDMCNSSSQGADRRGHF